MNGSTSDAGGWVAIRGEAKVLVEGSYCPPSHIHLIWITKTFPTEVNGEHHLIIVNKNATQIHVCIAYQVYGVSS